MDALRRPPVKTPRVLAWGTSWPTSWTTVYTCPQRSSVVIMAVSGVSTTAGSYDCQFALKSPDGTRVEISKDSVTAAGDEVSVSHMQQGQGMAMEENWEIQLLGSASNAVSYLIWGYQEFVQ